MAALSASRRYDLALLGAFTALYLAVLVPLAARAPLWFDELFLYHIARLPRLADVWRSLGEGLDANPPLVLLLTRLCQQMLGTSELVTRLPGLVGVWVLCVSLYGFVGRRCGRAYAIVAVLFTLATTACGTAWLARPYGWLLGCCGVAFVCWQRAAEGPPRRIALVGLTVSLACAFATHYYAFLVLVPFAVGELVRLVVRRRLDAGMALALAAGPATLVLLLPLALGASQSLAGFRWAPPWATILHAYPFLVRAARWPFLAALLLVLWVRRRGKVPPLPAHEVAAALALMALPILGVCVGRWVTGLFTARYAMPAILGFAILLPFVTARCSGGSLALAGVLSAVFLVYFAVAQRDAYRQVGRLRLDVTRACEQLGRDRGDDLPIVVAEPFAFVQLLHYAPPELRPRLLYLSDPEAVRHCDPCYSCDWALRLLGRWTGAPVHDYHRFLAGHPRFLVYGENLWLPSNLKADGVAGRPVGA